MYGCMAVKLYGFAGSYLITYTLAYPFVKWDKNSTYLMELGELRGACQALSIGTRLVMSHLWILTLTMTMGTCMKCLVITIPT